MKKLALFDFDGTLFDTKDVNFHSYNKALEKYGYSIDYEYFCNYCNGRKYTEFLKDIATPEEMNQIHKTKKELYSKYLDKAKINKHLFEIINIIKNNYYIVIVTTASLKNTLDLLNYFEVKDYFDYFITQEDVTKTKPDPEGFLLAMNKFNISKEDTIIFEDSNVGIEAALKTGATVFRVTNF